MDSTLQEIRNFDNTGNISDLKASLQKLLSTSSNIELTTGDVFESLLRNEDKDVLLLSLQCIAEICKQEENRKILTTQNIIAPLITLIKTQDVNEILHCFRALGNISYENDEARNIIGPQGLQILISKINEVADTCYNKNTPNMMTVLSGCLLNILMSNDDLQKIALENDILNSIETILGKAFEHFEEQEDCITYVLQILSFVSDHMIDQWISEGLSFLLVSALRVSQNAEISVLCLEILRQQSENDDLKLTLAQLGACELVYELVQKYGNQVDDDESRAGLKLACDLIVLILTGDEAMKYLYDNSSGKVYHQMISWIDSSDVELMSTGILAIGNFARNDAHCIHMVQSGLSKKLIDMLARYSENDENDTKIQHAILSTLRHLSIPPQNKAILIQENIVEVLYKMINVDYFPVTFKLMGTFRMLVDGQESTACALINRKEFIQKIVHWCYNADHLGVRAEAPRLLVSLIKNSHSFEPFPMILSVTDSVKCLVDMISSLHTVMQNEALLALNLVCACYFRANDNDKYCAKITEQVKNTKLDNSKASMDCTDVAELFIKADVSKNIAFIINKYYEKMSFETVSNMVTLISLLSKSTSLVEHFKSCNMNEVLALLLKNRNIQDLNSEICALMSIFENDVKA